MRTSRGHEIDSFSRGRHSIARAISRHRHSVRAGISHLAAARSGRLVAEYDGWPQPGSCFHRDGSLWITDYHRGLLSCASRPRAGRATGSELETILGHRNSESFKGVNDLTFDSDGNCYFTDQGQPGLHASERSRTGCARMASSISPSAAFQAPMASRSDTTGMVIFIAVTRANAVWRGPLLADGSVTKVASFRTFFGTSGPDGMAADAGQRASSSRTRVWRGAFYLNSARRNHPLHQVSRGHDVSPTSRTGRAPEAGDHRIRKRFDPRGGPADCRSHTVFARVDYCG